MSSHTTDEWKRIVEAVESAVPLYESISEAISFRLARPLRRKAIGWLTRSKEGWTIDIGSGPGVSARLLVSRGFQKVVGLDPSQKLLKFAKSNTGSGFDPVVGVAESLPFRTETFDGILTCFALRDVKNLVQSLREVSRVAKPGSRFAIVDVGKPRGIVRRDLVWLYVRFGMPLVALLLARGRLPGNPFRMIIPTFHWLVTNDHLRVLIEREFGPSKLREFMLGGLVLFEARKAEKPKGRLSRPDWGVSERGKRIAAEVDKVAGELGCSSAQIALNWVRQQRGVVIPIVGATKPSQVKDNLGCLEVQLNQDQMKRLDEATKIDLGFPHEFLKDDEVRELIFGGTFPLIDNHRT